MRSSSDWVRTQSGEWVKAPIRQTRGLNRNSNRTLKGIFKGAATTVIGQARDEPLYGHYLQLLDGGTKPNLAKLTIARQIASIVLAVWRAGEPYDPKRLEGASKSGWLSESKSIGAIDSPLRCAVIDLKESVWLSA